MADGICCSCFVGYDQPARTEIYPAVVSHYDDKNVRKFVAVDLAKDGLAGRAARFAVVVGPECRPVRTEHVGVADMAGVIILLSVCVQNFRNLVYGCDMMGKGEELTPLFGVISLAYVRYCFIFVGHFFVVVNSVRMPPIGEVTRCQDYANL